MTTLCDLKNNPFREDACHNWVSSISYGDNNARAESIAYFDNGGRPTQAQVRMRSTNTVLASEVLYDRFGRQAISTLQAPTEKCYFKYDANFTGGYHHTDFDAVSNRNNPAPIPSSSTLGHYYSTQNAAEPFVDISAWPYSRTDFVDDPTGQVRKAAGVGDAYRMGQGREAYTATVPVHQELDHYLSLRHHFTLHPANATTLLGKATKSISRDPQGNYAVRFGDLAVCTIDPNMAANDRQVHLVDIAHEATFTRCNVDDLADFSIEGTQYVELYSYPYTSGNSAIYTGNPSGLALNTLNVGHTYVLKSGKSFSIRIADNFCDSPLPYT